MKNQTMAIEMIMPAAEAFFAVEPWFVPAEGTHRLRSGLS